MVWIADVFGMMVKKIEERKNKTQESDLYGVTRERSGRGLSILYGPKDLPTAFCDHMSLMDETSSLDHRPAILLQRHETSNTWDTLATWETLQT